MISSDANYAENERMAAPSKCPLCGGDRVSRSRTRRWDFLVNLLAPLFGEKKPYRCLNCNQRFWQKVKLASAASGQKSKKRRQHHNSESTPEEPAETAPPIQPSPGDVQSELLT
jgi:hypothetical protein